MHENVYYNPEAFGLRTVGEIDRSEPYEFDIFVLFQANSDGHLWWASDSGCSCPTPFEDKSFEDGLHEIHNPQELIDALDEWANDYYADHSEYNGKVGELILKAREVGKFE